MSQPLMATPSSTTRRSRSVTSTMFTHVMKDVLDIEDDEEVMLICKERRIKDIEELRNKKLFCVCHPLPCHGDILIKYL